MVKYNGKWTAVGLASWGSSVPCGAKPGVYTNIAAFHKWLNPLL